MKKLVKANHILLAILCLSLAIRVRLDTEQKKVEFYRGTYAQCQVDIWYFAPLLGILYGSAAICNENTWYAANSDAYGDAQYSDGFHYPPPTPQPHGELP